MRLCVIVFLAVIFSCSKDERKINDVKLINPLNDAFKNSRIKYIVSINELDSILNDTLFFDIPGNLIRRTFGMNEFRVEYDSNGFYKRFLQKSDDAFTQYIVVNEFDRNQLLQYRIPVLTDKWDHYPLQLDSSKIDTVSYSFSNNLITEVRYYNFFKRMNYQEGMLISEESFNFEEDIPFFKIEYKYNALDNLIKSIKLYHKDTIEVNYFSSGILDSTLYYGAMKYYSIKKYYE